MLYSKFFLSLSYKSIIFSMALISPSISASLNCLAIETFWSSGREPPKKITLVILPCASTTCIDSFELDFMHCLFIIVTICNYKGLLYQKRLCGFERAKYTLSMRLWAWDTWHLEIMMPQPKNSRFPEHSQQIVVPGRILLFLRQPCFHSIISSIAPPLTRVQVVSCFESSTCSPTLIIQPFLHILL